MGLGRTIEMWRTDQDAGTISGVRRISISGFWKARSVTSAINQLDSLHEWQKPEDNWIDDTLPAIYLLHRVSSDGGNQRKPYASCNRMHLGKSYTRCLFSLQSIEWAPSRRQDQLYSGDEEIRRAHVHLGLLETSIVIQVDAFEPIVQTDVIPLVLFTQNKPDKVLVIHFAFLWWCIGPFDLQGLGFCSRGRWLSIQSDSWTVKTVRHRSAPQ